MCVIEILTEGGGKNTWMLFRYGLGVLVYVVLQNSADAVCLEEGRYILVFNHSLQLP